MVNKRVACTFCLDIGQSIARKANPHPAGRTHVLAPIAGHGRIVAPFRRMQRAVAAGAEGVLASDAAQVDRLHVLAVDIDVLGAAVAPAVHVSQLPRAVDKAQQLPRPVRIPNSATLLQETRTCTAPDSKPTVAPAALPQLDTFPKDESSLPVLRSSPQPNRAHRRSPCQDMPHPSAARHTRRTAETSARIHPPNRTERASKRVEKRPATLAEEDTAQFDRTIPAFTRPDTKEPARKQSRELGPTYLSARISRRDTRREGGGCTDLCRVLC